MRVLTLDVSKSAIMPYQMGARSKEECGAAALCNSETQLPLGPKTVQNATECIKLKAPQGLWPTPLSFSELKTVQGQGGG